MRYLLLFLVGCGEAPLHPSSGCEGACALADAAVEDAAQPKPDLARLRDLSTANDLTPNPSNPPPDLAPPADPLQPATHPDDSALRDPSRVSNCSGLAPLDPSQVADFFPDGAGFWSVAADARKSEFTKTRFTDQYRSCNQVTGCEQWYYVVPNTNEELILIFTYDGDQLWLQEYDRFGALITQRLVDGPLVTASLAVDTATNGGWEMRRMAVILTDKRICLESLITTTTDANGSHDRIVLASFSRDHTALPPRPSPQPLPSPSPTCTGAPASHSELVAWFQPGKTTATLLGETRTSVERECHPLTGCSSWRAPLGTFFDYLAVQGTSIAVHAREPGVGGQRDYTLSDSAFSSSTLDIVFTPTCARAVGSVVTPGPNGNQLETQTVASVPKP
jgi:hypothetical protein